MNMKWIIFMFAGAWFALGLQSAAAAACSQLGVKAYVEVEGGELTLANLLSPNTCSRLQTMAARVSLGVAPLRGTVRVLRRSQVRSLLEGLAAASGMSDEMVSQVPAQIEVPAQIIVQRAGATKSCAAIADFARRSSTQTSDRSFSLENFNCAAAQSIPEDAPLELTKTSWNAALQRWEFSLRCTRAEECVPFMVWARARSAGHNYDSESSAMRLASLGESSGAYAAVSERLIKPGQTATLRWDERGIRIVLPVTCLDGGGLGQTVRVRFKNAGRILRAEILSDGTLRAGL